MRIILALLALVTLANASASFSGCWQVTHAEHKCYGVSEDQDKGFYVENLGECQHEASKAAAPYLNYAKDSKYCQFYRDHNRGYSMFLKNAQCEDKKQHAGQQWKIYKWSLLCMKDNRPCVSVDSVHHPTKPAGKYFNFDERTAFSMLGRTYENLEVLAIDHWRSGEKLKNNINVKLFTSDEEGYAHGRYDTNHHPDDWHAGDLFCFRGVDTNRCMVQHAIDGGFSCEMIEHFESKIVLDRCDCPKTIVTNVVCEVSGEKNQLLWRNH